MAPAELKQTLEISARIVRLIEDLPIARQAEIMAVAQTLVTIEAQRALREGQTTVPYQYAEKRPMPEVKDE